MSAAVEEGAEALPAKDNPEKFVLRGRPRRAVRFRKGLLVGLTGGLSAGLAALAWVALEPSGFRFAAHNDEGRPFERPRADAVAGAPAAYSDVPKLGPPLPGDLGRPILEQQRRLAASADTAAPSPLDAAAQEALAERQRRAAEEQAARTSALLAQLSSPAELSEAVPANVGRSAGVQDRIEPAQASGRQSPKVEFARSEESGVNPHLPMRPASPWTVAAGSIIPASLISGMNSDLPGLVLAQVTENVRDSATGGAILIPQGARLIGQYDSGVTYGQRRALLVWQRIIFPDGRSLQLDKMPATDSAGYSGLEGRVNSHPWQLLKGVILSSVLGLGSELSLGGSEVARAIRQSAQQNGARAGDQLVRRSLDIQPTLTVPPGWPVRVMVDKDLILEPWKG